MLDSTLMATGREFHSWMKDGKKISRYVRTSCEVCDFFPEMTVRVWSWIVSRNAGHITASRWPKAGGRSCKIDRAEQYNALTD